MASNRSSDEADISRQNQKPVHSKLYPRIHKLIMDKFDQIKREQIDPWRLFKSGKMKPIVTCRGKTIYYSGVGFSGSPVVVFCGPYLDECIEDVIVESLGEVIALCQGMTGAKKQQYLTESGSLLIEGMQDIYLEMARVYSRLSGNRDFRAHGYKVNRMLKFIEGQVMASKELCLTYSVNNSPNFEQRNDNKIRAEITQKDAAKLCGVSMRTIHNWDHGVRRPERYPGRFSAIDFSAWANWYQQHKRTTAAAKGMNKAIPTDPERLDRVGSRSAFEEE